VTAYDEYALRAFDVNAVDYLLKPYSPERFEEALERAKQRVGRAAAPPAAQLAAAARPEGEALERIVVRDGASVEVIPVARLDYAEAQDDYVALWSGGRSFLKQQTLASLEAALPPGGFVRIHRSYLLRLDRLAKIEPTGKDTREAVLRDGTRLPVSRSGYQRLRGVLGEG
jgi:two-component system LytT family response regulator